MARGFTDPIRSHSARLALVAAACTALLAVAAVPAQAAEPPGDGDATLAVGDFAIGDALEAAIDEGDGSLGITLPIGGVELRWDSRAATAGDRFALGAGWGYRLGFVDIEGGVRLVPPTSAEVFEADATAPSGLRGYALGDLMFRRVQPDALPGRPDAALDHPSVAAFAVHELGGTSTYYNHAGDPVAQISLHGDRTDWQWSPAVPHRLERIVDPDGVVTTLDWASEEHTLIVRHGANLLVETGGSDRAWRVRFNADGAISELTDPAGRRTGFDYRSAELAAISGASGSSTRIDWQRFDDGVPRVRSVSTVSDAGEQLSARTWDRFGAAAPSGWPFVDAAFASGPADEADYQTALSDGVTEVRSRYSGGHLLRSREVRTHSAGGEQLLQRQDYEYPSGGAGADTPAAGGVQARPIGAAVTRFDAAGASRSERAAFAYDAFGRVSTTTDPAGNVTAYEYDRAGALLRVVQRDAVGAELARVEYELDDFDRPARMTRGNGVVTAYSYTNAGEISSETTTSGAEVISDRAYTYDPRGLVTERVDQVNDARGASERTITRYAYDERERLIESTVTDHPVDGAEPTATEAPPRLTTSYELSVAGDVTAETITRSGDGAERDGAERSRERRFDYSPAGELTGITDDSGRVGQRYDAAGNLVQAVDGTTLTYDAADRPVTETTRDGAVIETTYWADGSRRGLSTTGPDGTVRSTEFTWAGDELLGETHRTGDERTTAAYLLGAGRQARTTIGADEPDTAYYGTDRHGNVTDLTSVDGRVTERYAYSDYGAETASGADETTAAPTCTATSPGDPERNPFRYSGEYTDPSCRQHLAARAYDAGTMRFTSHDPSAVMNPYAYADANPITRVDPTGNSAEDDAPNGHLTNEEWGWNFATLVIGLAGLVGTGLSFLAPITAFQAVMLTVGGLGDIIGVVTSSVRWALQNEISRATSDRLGEFDVVMGTALVGVGFGLRAVGKWYAQRQAVERVTGLAVTQAERRLNILQGGDHTLVPLTNNARANTLSTSNLGEAGEHSPFVMNSATYDSRLPSKNPFDSLDPRQGYQPQESVLSNAERVGNAGSLPPSAGLPRGRSTSGVGPSTTNTPAASVVNPTPPNGGAPAIKVPGHPSAPSFSSRPGDVGRPSDVLDVPTTVSSKFR